MQRILPAAMGAGRRDTKKTKGQKELVDRLRTKSIIMILLACRHDHNDDGFTDLCNFHFQLTLHSIQVPIVFSFQVLSV